MELVSTYLLSFEFENIPSVLQFHVKCCVEGNQLIFHRYVCKNCISTVGFPGVVKGWNLVA